MSWDKIQPILAYFTVWQEQPEMAWFRKAWESLAAASLTRYSDDAERHWVLFRAVAIGLMYSGYCFLEWDEYPDDETTVRELFGDESFNHVRIGTMAEEWVGMEDANDSSLFVAAVFALQSEVRLGIYDALVSGFGDACLLYAGLYTSREVGNDQESLDHVAAELFDESGFLLEGREEAFAYVTVASMLAVDA